MEHYQQKLDGTYSHTPNDTETMSGIVEQDASITLKNYHGFENGTYTNQKVARNGSTVVKVYYERKTIRLHFAPNGGIIDGSSDQKTISGKYGANLVLPTPKRDGYTHEKWLDNNSHEPPTTFTLECNNTSYTAQWRANTYKLTFNGNGSNNGTMSEQQCTYDSAQNLSENKFRKTGHLFKGWSTTASGTVEYTDTQSVKNLSAVDDETVPLYAVWKAANLDTIEMADIKAYDKKMKPPEIALSFPAGTWFLFKTRNGKYSILHITAVAGDSSSVTATFEYKTFNDDGTVLSSERGKTARATSRPDKAALFNLETGALITNNSEYDVFFAYAPSSDKVLLMPSNSSKYYELE